MCIVIMYFTFKKLKQTYYTYPINISSNKTMSTQFTRPPQYLYKTYGALRSFTNYALSTNGGALTDDFVHTFQTMLNDSLPKTEIEKVQAATMRSLCIINKFQFKRLLQGSRCEAWLLWASIGSVLADLGLLGRLNIRRGESGYVVAIAQPTPTHPAASRIGAVDEAALHHEIMNAKNGGGSSGAGASGADAADADGHQAPYVPRGRGRGGFRGGRGRGAPYAPRGHSDGRGRGRGGRGRGGRGRGGGQGNSFIDTYESKVADDDEYAAYTIPTAVAFAAVVADDSGDEEPAMEPIDVNQLAASLKQLDSNLGASAAASAADAPAAAAGPPAPAPTPVAVTVPQADEHDSDDDPIDSPTIAKKK